MKSLIVYHHLPHYRHGVFCALDKTEGVEFEFAADTRSHRDAIPTMLPDSLQNFHRLKNHWIGPFLWQTGLLRLILMGRYDTVIFLGDFSFLSTWIGAMACRLLKKRVLFWTIGWHKRDSGLRRIARLTFYHLAHELLLYGNVGLSIGQSLNFPTSRMRVIGNSHHSNLEKDTPCTAAKIEKLKAQLPPVGREVIGAVIRLNPEKRLDLLVRAAAILTNGGRNISLLIVGTGPEEDRLHELGSSLGVDLNMVGACYSLEELETIYDRLLVTVVPVYAGLTAIQSLKFGCPAITSDNIYKQAPESECIRRGITGDYFSDQDVQSLASTIASLLDRVLRDRSAVAQACRAEIERNWSVSAHASAILKALDSEGH